MLLKEGADAWNNNDAAALAAMFTADAVIVTDRPVYGEPEFDSGPFLDLSVTMDATAEREYVADSCFCSLHRAED